MSSRRSVRKSRYGSCSFHRPAVTPTQLTRRPYTVLCVQRGRHDNGGARRRPMSTMSVPTSQELDGTGGLQPSAPASSTQGRSRRRRRGWRVKVREGAAQEGFYSVLRKKLMQSYSPEPPSAASNAPSPSHYDLPRATSNGSSPSSAASSLPLSSLERGTDMDATPVGDNEPAIGNRPPRVSPHLMPQAKWRCPLLTVPCPRCMCMCLGAVCVACGTGCCLYKGFRVSNSCAAPRRRCPKSRANIAAAVGQ